MSEQNGTWDQETAATFGRRVRELTDDLREAERLEEETKAVHKTASRRRRDAQDTLRGYTESYTQALPLLDRVEQNGSPPADPGGPAIRTCIRCKREAVLNVGGLCLGCGTVPAEPVKPPATRSSAFEGEYIGGLVGHGETVDQLRKKIEAASICDKFQQAVKDPIKVRPFTLRGDADLYVNAGGVHQYGHSSYRALKIYDPDVFREEFPGRDLRIEPRYWDGMPDHERSDSYWGVRVRLAGDRKGKELVIGTLITGRVLTTYPGAGEESPPERKKPDMASPERGRAEAKRRAKLHPEDEVLNPPAAGKAPITRDTFLIDLVPGKDPSSVGRALEGAGLHTVGDLLATCQGSRWKGEPEAQRPYIVLRGLKGAGSTAALAIGDALVEAGLVGAAAPSPATVPLGERGAVRVPADSVKEVWQMTVAEYLDSDTFKATKYGPSELRRLKDARKNKTGADLARAVHDLQRGDVMESNWGHRHAVKLALEEGQTVPAEVIAEYPDLATVDRGCRTVPRDTSLFPDPEPPADDPALPRCCRCDQLFGGVVIEVPPVDTLDLAHLDDEDLLLVGKLSAEVRSRHEDGEHVCVGCLRSLAAEGVEVCPEEEKPKKQRRAK